MSAMPNVSIVPRKGISEMTVKIRVTAGIAATLLTLLGIAQGLALGGIIGEPMFNGWFGGLLPMVCGVLATVSFRYAFVAE